MRKPSHWLALALALVAFAASALVADQVYERLPHLEDEFAFLWQAEVMAQGKITLDSPSLPESFLVPFVVDYQGQRFGKYPPGWPAMLSLGARVDAAWLVNPILAALCVWLMYRLGHKIINAKIGLLAAALTLSSPMFLMLSGSLMGHMLSLYLSLAFSLAWLDLFPLDQRPKPTGIPTGLLIAVAGSSLGLLALTRPLTAVGVGLPFGLHGFWRMSQNRQDRPRVLTLGLLALALGALLLVWQAALTGDPWLNPYRLWWPYDRLGFGPGIGVYETGHSPLLAYWNTRFSLRAGMHDLFGWPYVSWIFIPFGLLAFRRKDSLWLLLSVFVCLVGVYALYWVGAWLYGPRYYFEALPGLSLASAAGILWLGGWLQDKAARAVWRQGLVGGLVIVLVMLNARYYLPARMAMMHDLNEISRQRLAPLAQADLGQALVFVHPDNWHGYATLMTLAPPFADDGLILAYSRGSIYNAQLKAEYPGLPVYHYDPERPYRLILETSD